MSTNPNIKSYENSLSAFKRAFINFLDRLSKKISNLSLKVVNFTDSRSTLKLQDNTIYKYTGRNGIVELNLQYPTTDFICTIFFSTSKTGDIVVNFPSNTSFVGNTNLEFFNAENWELNILNGIVSAVQITK